MLVFTQKMAIIKCPVTKGLYHQSKSKQLLVGLRTHNRLVENLTCLPLSKTYKHNYIYSNDLCVHPAFVLQHPFIHEPMVKTIEKTFALAKPKIVFIGDGADRRIALALCQHFDKEKTYPTSQT